MVAGAPGAALARHARGPRQGATLNRIDPRGLTWGAGPPEQRFLSIVQPFGPPPRATRARRWNPLGATSARRKNSALRSAQRLAR
eukprot:2107761-Pyramimonas_sp.AAC.1